MEHKKTGILKREGRTCLQSRHLKVSGLFFPELPHKINCTILNKSQNYHKTSVRISSLNATWFREKL